MRPAGRIACIPIPSEMRALPRDARGYPIPAVVFRDTAGHPHFTINDDTKTTQALQEDRCTICWGRLTRGRWFTGGPLSALHENGVYADPPTHKACAVYALQVCPYLAAPSYAKRIDDRTLVERAGIAIAMNPTMLAERPLLFVLAMAVGQTVRWGIQPTIRPRRPYKAIEYWQSGTRLADTDGKALVSEILSQAAPKPRQPRLIVP